MELNSIVSLVIVSLIGCIKGRLRLDRWLSWFMLFAVLHIFSKYVSASIGSLSETFSLLWSNSKLGPITIDFYPTQEANKIIIPLFLILIISIINNNVFRYEERRSMYNSLIIMNFITLCMFVCSQNYIQLITAIFVSDIIGYLILKDVDTSRLYVIYNFFADMCIFMILSLICGRIQSLDINHLLNYNEIGKHKNFVCLTLSLATFIKIGCVPFHNYLLELSSVRFQRMSVINLLFSPLIGILFLVKLNNLFVISDVFLSLYTVICYLTFFISILLFIIKDNFCKKSVYFNMSAYSILLLILADNNFEWSTSSSIYYMIIFFYNILFFMLYLYQNRVVSTYAMLNANNSNKLALYSILMMFVLLSNIFFSLLIYIAEDYNRILYLGIGLLLSLTIVLNSIYRSPNTLRLDYLNANHLRSVIFIINFVIFLWACVYFNLYKNINIIFSMMFLAIICLFNSNLVRSIYNQKNIQNKEISKNIYLYLIVSPLMYISRILWLSIDSVFTQKIVENIIKNLNRTSISIFFKLNKKSYTSSFMFILIGVMIFIASFYWRTK